MNDVSITAYPTLLSPLTIGRHTFKNRVIMGTMAAGIVTYGVAGRQYVGAASGKGSLFMAATKGAPTIVVFKLPADVSR